MVDVSIEIGLCELCEFIDVDYSYFFDLVLLYIGNNETNYTYSVEKCDVRVHQS